MKVKTDAILEAMVSREADSYLDRLAPECWYYKPNDGVTQGIPDRLGCYLGFFFAIEFKRPKKGKATILQNVTLSKIKGSYGFHCIATSIRDVQELMRHIKITSIKRGLHEKYVG